MNTFVLILESITLLFALALMTRYIVIKIKNKKNNRKE